MTRLIDADPLKEKIDKIVDEEIKVDEKWAIGLRYSLKLIDNAPTVDPDKPLFSEVVFLERSKSEWIERENEKWGGVWYQCSNCGLGVTRESLPMNFCPECGSDMRGTKE